MSEPLVLGIETSCDETAIGIVRGRTLLANEIASSVQEHARFGGVVPEIASRAHLEAMIPALDRALASAKVSLKDIDAISFANNVRPCTIPIAVSSHEVSIPKTNGSLMATLFS